MKIGGLVPLFLLENILNLILEYTHNDAKTLSVKGNPIPLYALALQGHNFTDGNIAPVKSGMSLNIFTGVKIRWDDPTIVGLLTGVLDPMYPNLIISNAGKLVSRTMDTEIYLNVTTFDGAIVPIEYGKKLAELYFIQLAEI